MQVYDISMEIGEGMITYPGNPKFRIKQIMRISEDSSNLSELVMGAHTGTHVDSKLHIKNNAPGVDKISLEKCYGQCKVLDLTEIKFGEGIEREHLAKFNLAGTPHL